MEEPCRTGQKEAKSEDLQDGNIKVQERFGNSRKPLLCRDESLGGVLLLSRPGKQIKFSSKRFSQLTDRSN